LYILFWRLITLIEISIWFDAIFTAVSFKSFYKRKCYLNTDTHTLFVGKHLCMFYLLATVFIQKYTFFVVFQIETLCKYLLLILVFRLLHAVHTYLTYNAPIKSNRPIPPSCLACPTCPPMSAISAAVTDSNVRL
jgi:hypothetical protein